MRKSSILILTALTVLVVGCDKMKSDTNSDTNIDQSDVCVVSKINKDDIQKCTPGKLIFLSPQTWGSEKVPIELSAFFCDTNHQVIYNNSGVLCVYTDKRMHKIK